MSFWLCIKQIEHFIKNTLHRDCDLKGLFKLSVSEHLAHSLFYWLKLLVLEYMVLENLMDSLFLLSFL